jgi:hypothetical protein
VRRVVLVALLLGGLPLIAACQSDTYVVVTVDARATVHAAASLSVTLGNDGMSQTDALQLGMHEFPVTFSIDATGRTGDLTVGVDAFDANMLLVGRGSGTAPIASANAQVILDGADFVVNTEYAGDQELSGFIDTNGYQLAAEADGTWTVPFHGDCTSPCDMDARRFDSTGAPVSSNAAAGTNQFEMDTMQANDPLGLAGAGAGAFTMGFWDFEGSDLTTAGVACQAIDDSGDVLDNQGQIGSDAITEIYGAAAVGSNLFAVVWNAEPGSDVVEVIRGVVTDTTCTPVTNTLQTISTNGSAGIDSAFNAHIAANGEDVLYAWMQGSNDVHVRSASAQNALGSDVLLIPTGTTNVVEYVRVAPMADGFAVVVRMASTVAMTDPGSILLYKVNVAGAIQFGPVLISSTTGSDCASVQSFGVATRADGAILVTWHACGANGDGQGCGVFARIVRPTGVPVGDQFVVETTLVGDQTAPSAVGTGSAFAVAWNDASDQQPDTSGLAVRARVVEPAYDDATAVLGAPCSQTSPCGAGLTCQSGTDQVARCYETCPAGSGCPDGGTCTNGGCVF